MPDGYRIPDDSDVPESVHDAITTRGPRLPFTLTGYRDRPVAAYNLGYQEGRESVTKRTGEPDPDVQGWDDQESEDKPALAEEVSQAELPVEYRITDSFLDGYAQGFREGRHGRHR
jgi:hypothetical protein